MGRRDSTIKIGSNVELTLNRAGFEKTLEKAELKTLEVLAILGVELAKEKAAYLTGEMRDSIDCKIYPDKKSFAIFTNDFKAPFVHFGTSMGQEPQPFIDEIKRRKSKAKQLAAQVMKIT